MTDVLVLSLRFTSENFYFFFFFFIIVTFLLEYFLKICIRIVLRPYGFRLPNQGFEIMTKHYWFIIKIRL